jgi:NAD(P)H-hydrate epimerase
MSVPVINIEEMREWEAATWAAGQTEAEVIRRVGRCVAQCARGLTGPDEAILILAGKGHNGDDARAAREFLADRKIKTLELLSPETDLPALASALGERPALIIDGIFGIGLNRPLVEPWQKIIAAVNAANLPVLAVDVPSGINADTGDIFGAAINAAVTLTVGAPKTGLLATAAGPWVGRLEVASDVGLVPCPLKSDLIWTEAGDFQSFPPPRPAAGHKGSFGHVALVAGSMGYHGAAVLATRGAQRAQPGLTTVFTQENVYQAVASQLQSAMVGIWRPDMELPANVSALAVGPGLAAREVAENLRPMIRHWWRDLDYPVLVDASALGFLTAGPIGRKCCRVLTPHPGEAARLLNCATQKVQANRVAALREISKKYGNCWVVLKGCQTLIGRSEGEIFVNSSGNPHLAQGGSGDLLSGFIAGLLAQPALQADVATTLRHAVWQHGAAADQLQAARANWTVEELADEIGDVRAEDK